MDATIERTDPIEASVEETGALVRAVKLEVARRLKLAAEARRRAELAVSLAETPDEIAALGDVLKACRSIVPGSLIAQLAGLEVQMANLTSYVRVRNMTRVPVDALSDEDEDVA